MLWILISPQGAQAYAEPPPERPAHSFVWLDVAHSEALADPAAFSAAVAQLTQVQLFDLHVQDALNPQHPSYFDSTQSYDMLIFRKLAMAEAIPLAEAPVHADARRTLQEIVTRPITFFLFENALVTVRIDPSRTIEQARQRLLEPRARAHADLGGPERLRIPHRPEELMLRLLNGMVDRYLELRQPLTDRLDRWQRELLDPRRPFANWIALLDARIELRKLENLSEEQYDALQEMRDNYLEATPEAHLSDAFLVRINDVMEHIQRVLSHALRLEASAESAVQLHFSATAHRTNQVMRTLTVVTAVFAPLTLITGIFGMNFERMPLLRHPDGFGLTLLVMGLIAAGLLLFFWTRQLLIDRPRQLRWRKWLRAQIRLNGSHRPD
jgi:Mg2+ and Co2+ transporter CorA